MKRSSEQGVDSLIRVGVVVPCLNEEESIETLVEEILESLKKSGGFSLQIVVVDDGSDDDTWILLERLQGEFLGLGGAESRARLKPIRHNRKLGKSAAQLTGIINCDDLDFMVFLDGDGQHNPQVIPEMIQLANDLDLPVFGRRIQYRRTFFESLFGSLFEFTLRVLGSRFSLEESEFLVLPGRQVLEIRSHPMAGAAPLIPIVKSLGSAIVPFDIRIRTNSHRKSHFGPKEFWGKGIAELFTNPPQLFPRVFGLVLALALVIAAYGIFAGISSVAAGEYSGIGSVMLIQSLMFLIICGLNLLIFGTISQLMRASHLRFLTQHGQNRGGGGGM